MNTTSRVVVLLVLAACGTAIASASLGSLGANPYRDDVMRCYGEGMYAFRRLMHVMQSRPNDMASIMAAYWGYTAIRVRYATLTRLYWTYETKQRHGGCFGSQLDGRPSGAPPERPSVGTATVTPAPLHHGVVDGHNVMADVQLQVGQQWSFSLPVDETPGYRWNEHQTDGTAVRLVATGATVEAGRACTLYRFEALAPGTSQYTLEQRSLAGGTERRVLNFNITVAGGTSVRREDQPPDYGDVHYRY